MPKFAEKTHLLLLGFAILLLGAGAFYFSNARDAVPGIPDDRYETSPALSERTISEHLKKIEKEQGIDIPIYLSNTSLSTRENLDCSEVFPVMRRMVNVGEPGIWPGSALLHLLSGPMLEEVEMGYTTNIPSEIIEFSSFHIEDGVAYVEFSSDFHVAGSCRVIAIRAQIEKTLTQFPEIDSVVIAVEGKTPEESLQP